MKGKKAPKKIPCKHAELGCNIMVFPREMDKHNLVCLYQKVECEGCGDTMFLKDQVTHQKIKKCIEKKVKNDRICHAKRAHSDMMKYNQRMKSLKAGIEVMNWQRLKGLVHEKHGWTPRVPNAWGEEFEHGGCQSPHSHLQMSMPAILDDDPRDENDTVDGRRHNEMEDEREAIHSEKQEYTKTPSHSPRQAGSSSKTSKLNIPIKLHGPNERRDNEVENIQAESLQNNEYTKTPSYSPKLDKPNSETTQGDGTQKEKFSIPQVTFANHTDNENGSTTPCSTCETSKRSHSARAPSLCVRCGRFFRLGSNHDTACQYHEGVGAFPSTEYLFLQKYFLSQYS